MFQAHPERQLTKITLLVVSSLTVMASATIAPTLPAMHAAFSDLPNVDLLVRLVLTIPGLFIVLGAPAAGFIVDSYGRKRLLVVSTFLYAITGSAGYFFDSMTAILIGRALLGIAVAGVMISVTTLIADYYQGEARARFLGRQAAFMNFGGVLFTAAGGFLADVTWQTPFLIYARRICNFALYCHRSAGAETPRTRSRRIRLRKRFESYFPDRPTLADIHHSARSVDGLHHDDNSVAISPGGCCWGQCYTKRPGHIRRHPVLHPAFADVRSH